MSKYINVGETIEVNGKTYRAFKANNDKSCSGCDFLPAMLNNVKPLPCDMVDCVDIDKYTGSIDYETAIIFKEVK